MAVRDAQLAWTPMVFQIPFPDNGLLNEFAIHETNDLEQTEDVREAGQLFGPGDDFIHADQNDSVRADAGGSGPDQMVALVVVL